MEIIATQKYIRMSPQKVRLVADAVRHIKDPEKLIAYLTFVKKQGALPLIKTVKQALANAKNNKGIVLGLVVKELQIGEGPRLKRYRAGSMGRAQPILKRTSHIRVILEEKPQENSKHEAQNPN